MAEPSAIYFLCNYFSKCEDTKSAVSEEGGDEGCVRFKEFQPTSGMVWDVPVAAVVAAVDLGRGILLHRPRRSRCWKDTEIS